MKRILIAILCISFLGLGLYTDSADANWFRRFLAQQQRRRLLSKGCASGSECSITFWLGFEGTVTGSEYDLDGTKDYSTDSDYEVESGEPILSGATISSGASDRGNGLDCPDGSDSLNRTANQPPYLEGIYGSGDLLVFVKFRIYAYVLNTRLFYLSQNDGGDYSEVYMRDSDELSLKWVEDFGASLYATSTDWNLDVSTGTWYVAFFAVDTDNEYLRIYCYNYSTGSQVGSIVNYDTSGSQTLEGWDNQLYKLMVGNNTVNAGDLHIAVFGISTDISTSNISKILDYIRLRSDDYPG